MNDMAAVAQSKARYLTDAVTKDDRWQIEDELMCQVFGFTMYGYVFGVGRILCFMDVEDINDLATQQLLGLGIGPAYAAGLVQAAHNEFIQAENASLHNRLIGIGHSHFAAEDLCDLVESVFQNAERIRDSIS